MTSGPKDASPSPAHRSSRPSTPETEWRRLSGIAHRAFLGEGGRQRAREAFSAFLFFNGEHFRQVGHAHSARHQVGEEIFSDQLFGQFHACINNLRPIAELGTRFGDRGDLRSPLHRGSSRAPLGSTRLRPDRGRAASSSPRGPRVGTRESPSSTPTKCRSESSTKSRVS